LLLGTPANVGYAVGKSVGDEDGYAETPAGNGARVGIKLG